MIGKKQDVRYYIAGYKRAKATSTRDVLYTMKMLKRISNSWENLYKKLKYYQEEKIIFDMYKATGISWKDFEIISGSRT